MNYHVAKGFEHKNGAVKKQGQTTKKKDEKKKQGDENQSNNDGERVYKEKAGMLVERTEQGDTRGEKEWGLYRVILSRACWQKGVRTCRPLRIYLGVTGWRDW